MFLLDPRIKSEDDRLTLCVLEIRILGVDWMPDQVGHDILKEGVRMTLKRGLGWLRVVRDDMRKKQSPLDGDCIRI